MRIVSIVSWIVGYQLVGGLIGMATRTEIEGWYQGLAKPVANPPDALFPIVWPLLYAMIAIAGERLWRSRSEPEGGKLLGLFAVQTVFNWLWTPIFFNLHWLGFALVWIVALTALVAWLVAAAWKRQKVVAGLLLPYLAWIAFATYLSYRIWKLNP